ncbi:MAG: hypothetical protein QXY76_03340 [Nitrososphaeria archaeon]
MPFYSIGKEYLSSLSKVDGSLTIIDAYEYLFPSSSSLLGSIKKKMMAKLVAKTADYLLSGVMGNTLSGVPFLSSSINILRKIITKEFMRLMFRDVEGSVTFPYFPKSLNEQYDMIGSNIEPGFFKYNRYSWGLKLSTFRLEGWVNTKPFTFLKIFSAALTQAAKIAGIGGSFLSHLFTSMKRIMDNEPILFSEGWMTLESFRYYLKKYGNRPQIFFLTDMKTIWYGWITSFSYPLDAFKAFSVDWSMNVVVHPLTGFSATSDYETTAESLKVLLETSMIEIPNLRSLSAWIPQRG